MQDTETAQEGGDDLRAQIVSAMEPEEQNEPGEQTELEPESENKETEESDDRDEQGRFKKKDDDKEAPEKEDSEKEEESEKADDKEQIPPPQHWKGAGKVDWNKLPQNVKQAISEDYNKLTETETQYQGLEQVLKPRRDALAANYGSVENGIDYLFKLSDFASNDPQGFVQWFAQQRGVDLQAPTNEQPEGTQDVAALQNHIKQLEQQVQQLPQQLQQQTQSSALESQIQAFASDPAHPYFEDVKLAMGGLLQTGAAKTLEDAYEMAVYADPNLRGQLLNEQREKEAEEKRKKAEAAKQAAGSMAGAPAGSEGDQPADNLREEIARAMSSNRV